MPASPRPPAPAAAAPPDAAAAAARCERLRGLVADALAKQSPHNAAFFAEKLVAFGGDRVDDVALLARAYHAGGAYARAVNLLKRHHLLDAPRPDTLGHRLLATRCLTAAGRREEAAALVDEALPDEAAALALAAAAREASGAAPGDGLSVVAQLCVLRAELCDAREERPGTAHWYTVALRCDAYAQEAWDALIGQHMLPEAEEARLLASLTFREDDQWLKALYAARLDRYDHTTPVSQRFRALDVEHGLVDSIDVVSARADAHLHRLEPERALHLTAWVRERDPFDDSCTLVHLCALARLGRKSDLYAVAHQLVEAQPERASSWFAVGLYYAQVGKHDLAARYFRKATALGLSAAAWVGYGNALSAQDESDQALAAYRTAHRLFPGCHQPVLAMAMEHARTNNLPLATQFADKAVAICPSDPVAHNELGVVRFRQGRFEEALTHLHKALALSGAATNRLETAWEPTLSNLGHAYRRLGDLANALTYYEKALVADAANAATHTAIGLTLQLQGRPDRAIEAYHRALALRPEDAVASEMLTRALQEAFAGGPPPLPDPPGAAPGAAERQFKRSLSPAVSDISGSPLSASGMSLGDSFNMSEGSVSMSGDDSGMSL